MAKLQACPHCGMLTSLVFWNSKHFSGEFFINSPPEPGSDDLTDDEGRPRYVTVVCSARMDGCGAHAGYWETPTQALENWNRRTP